MTPILNHYFARINWLGAAAANIDTLRALHLKHNCTIPFENLDVLLPREIQLDDQSLEDKLVIARRGGYCFEQNGVFERVLRELGFNVRSLGNDSNLLIVFYVQIMPDDFVMQLHRF